MMKIPPKFIGECLKKWRRVLLSSRDSHDGGFFPTNRIPRDVPKGHMAVYVGEDEKRYVVRVSVLEDPLFRALLDEARGSIYDFRTEPRLRVPCDENMLIDVLRRCASQEKRRTKRLCF
ncbi:hypothetical protein MLD38_035388 [Melastoma candidum]|uniref:Uncharacterized protein n=1 Tax=Melastoma candidum TaxID=119954 RepID=A0ACB9LGT9_9MYRT|nr:hypothetical protein MLD38_035388 [Melastoma candidum]